MTVKKNPFSPHMLFLNPIAICNLYRSIEPPSFITIIKNQFLFNLCKLTNKF